MRVTQKESTRAILIAIALTKLANQGISPFNKIGSRLMQRFIAAYRRKVPPPTYLVRPMFQSLVPILRDAAIVAYFKGMEFVYDSAPKQTSIVFAFKDVKREQQKRFRFSVADTRSMQQFYDAQSLVILNRVSDKQERVLRESMIDITRRNLHVKDGIAEIEKSFAKAGIVPRNSYEAENIFRTQTQLAYSAGQYAAEQDPAIQAILKAYKYVSVGDSRVRQTHANLHGLILHKNDAAWHTITPPNGFSCRCMRIPVFDDRKLSTGFDSEIINAGPDKGFDFHPGELAPINARGTYKSWIENKAKVGGAYKGQKMPLEWWQGKLVQYESKAGLVAVNPLTVDVVPPFVKLNAEQIEAETVKLAERLNADKVQFLESEEGGKISLSEKQHLMEVANEALDEMAAVGITKFPKLDSNFIFQTGQIGKTNFTGFYNRAIHGDNVSDFQATSVQVRFKGAKQILASRGRLDISRKSWNVEVSTRGVIRHEIAHSFHLTGFRETAEGLSENLAFQKEWKGVWRNSPVSRQRVSAYGATQEKELFAESFSAYTSSQYANNELSNKRLPPTIESFFIKHFGRHPNLK